jgi:hypothetical protein
LKFLFMFLTLRFLIDQHEAQHFLQDV